MLALLASLLKRLITAISSPFRMLLVRARRMLNINVISAKIAQPLTKSIKKLMTLRPSEKSDYINIGRFLVFKQLLMLIALAACAGVFIYFQMFAGKLEEAPVNLTGIKTDITFRYDDMAIKSFSGIANIKSFDGGVVYTGEIDKGVCKGDGLLYARDGRLLYEGGFSNNKYNGYGVKYMPDGNVEYEGEFVDNLYHGAGKLYNAKGGILYSGEFASGRFEGNGKLYDESGSLVYEGEFSQGQSHGAGTQYYPGGILHYRGEFFEGVFQGSGELCDKNGRLIYTGDMHGGKINYRALTGATLADLDAAFTETPGIYYKEDESSCFFYEKAGVAITVDCRVKVHEWEREKEDLSAGYYYIPNENAEWREEDSSDFPESAQDRSGTEASAEASNMENAENAEASWILPVASVRYQSESLTLTPMNWVVNDPYGSEASDNSNNSNSSGASESSGSSSGSDNSSSPDNGEDPREPATPTGNGEASKPDNNSPENSLPDFVNKTKALYFEIDKDVWQLEEDLDKSKVFVKRVTVLGSARPAESDVTPIEDNGQPGVEDCVMIDHIRRQEPTAFANVSFEMDKQNKLFRRIWNINNADRITRRAFIAGDVTYRFCYRSEDAETPVYYSIERQ